MNDNTPRITRRRYIDTLTRWVGPFMGWQVRGADNTNTTNNQFANAATYPAAEARGVETLSAQRLGTPTNSAGAA